MRQIKFRVWNGKGFVENDGVFISADGSKNEVYFNREQVAHNCALMQFTGLLDKNGKEIYEGDVVLIGITNEGEYRTVCEYGGGAFLLKHPHRGPFSVQFGGSAVHTFSVMGNIYENPDLIPKDK